MYSKYKNYDRKINFHRKLELLYIFFSKLVETSLISDKIKTKQKEIEKAYSETHIRFFEIVLYHDSYNICKYFTLLYEECLYFKMKKKNDK